jgi:hypothetical protein
MSNYMKYSGCKLPGNWDLLIHDILARVFSSKTLLKAFQLLKFSVIVPTLLTFL